MSTTTILMLLLFATMVMGILEKIHNIVLQRHVRVLKERLQQREEFLEDMGFRLGEMLKELVRKRMEEETDALETTHPREGEDN